MNADGEVAGDIGFGDTTADVVATTWDTSGNATLLPNGQGVNVVGLNASGDVVGQEDVDNTANGLLWTPGATAPTILSGDTDRNLYYNSINDEGDVVGLQALGDKNESEALVWSPTGSMTLLASIGTSNTYDGYQEEHAFAINDNGVIGGESNREWRRNPLESHKTPLKMARVGRPRRLGPKNGEETSGSQAGWAPGPASCRPAPPSL